MATPSSIKFIPISSYTCRRHPSQTLTYNKLYFNASTINNGGGFGIKFHPLNKIFTNIPVARADANHIDEPVEVNEDHGTTEPDADLVQQQKSNQLAKRVVFGLGIGISAGGVVLAGGWVFSVALAAAVFAGSREYFELVRSRGIASGMTPPPRYVSRVCSVICALMPLFTL
nr:phosphatidate cytidylyltransferase [Tanacetum cinerariifolium]